MLKKQVLIITVDLPIGNFSVIRIEKTVILLVYFVATGNNGDGDRVGNR